MTRRRQRRPGTIERAVIASTRAADWLEPADAAAVWAMRDLAEGLDVLRRRTATLQLLELDDVDPAGDLELRGQLAGRLLRGADALGLTPAGRSRLNIVRGDDDHTLAEVLAFDTG